MLEPGSMRVLHDALRPPPGFELDQLVLTTFTLDLVSLLTIPLAFTRFDAHADAHAVATEPLQLLAAVAHHADRITVFHQGGAVAVPSGQMPLLGLVEQVLVPVHAKHSRGIFHPKVWLARYRSADSNHFRLMCLSRNLTPDRSWDTMLVLEGAPTESPVATSRPLADFVVWLSRVAGRDANRASRLSALAAELLSVEFDVPPPFDALAFRPLGIDGHRDDPIMAARRDRLLAISPFVAEDRLERLFSGTTESVLVTRPEEFARLERPLDAARVSRVLQLDEALEPESDVNEERPWLEGLHAKVFVADQGWRATLWTGSANATDAAFSSNVEFLVELSGMKSVCGIDAILGGESSRALESMLAPCGACEPPPRPPGEARLDAEARRVADWPLQVQVSAADEGWTVSLEQVAAVDVPLDMDVTVRPLTTGAIAQPVTGAGLPRFDNLKAHEVTGLFVVELRLRDVDADGRAFVVSWPLVGTVPDRVPALIRATVTDRNQVMAFIRLFLAIDDAGGPLTPSAASEHSDRGRAYSFDQPVLELLLRALAREPQRVADLARWIPELIAAADEGDGVDELRTVWEPVWSAYQELHGDA